MCEQNQLSLKYTKDLEQKRQNANQKNSQVSSNYKNTQTEIQEAVKKGHSVTNDILLDFDNALEEVIAESKNSINDIVKKKPYLVAVIADVGDIIREILADTQKGILKASEESRTTVRNVQVDTESSVNNALDKFANTLSANSNDIDKILV